MNKILKIITVIIIISTVVLLLINYIHSLISNQSEYNSHLGKNIIVNKIQNRIENNNIEINPKDTLFLELSNEKLTGKYYVEYIHPKRGFYLKREKPTNDFRLYSLTFKDNGQVEFNDLTESYYCGNGILSFSSIKYKLNERNNYEINFEGEFSLDSKFKSKGEYKLTQTNKGKLYLYLTDLKAYETEFISE